MTDPDRGCLNKAAALVHDNPGSHLLLSGPVAERVEAARRYLLASGSVPDGRVSVSAVPGYPNLVQVIWYAATQAHPGPAPGKNGSLGSALGSVLDSLAGAKAGAMKPVQAKPEEPASVLVPRNAADGGTSGVPAPAKEIPAQGEAAKVAPAPVKVGAPPPAGALPPAEGQAAAPPPAPAADPYSVGLQVMAWEKRLQSGAIEFNNPGTLTVGEASGLVVVIHGYLDQSRSDLPGVKPQGVLPVSDRMRVDLEAPLAPDEFEITPAKGDTLPIPLDGSATWEFKITPLHESSSPQTLVIRPYLIPPANLGALQPLRDQPFTVQVRVQPFWQKIRELWSDDPIKVLKYLLPGGAGFSGIGAFFTGLIGLLTSLGIIAFIKRKIDARGNKVKGPPAAP